MNIVECLACKKPFDIEGDNLEKQAGFRGIYHLVKCPACQAQLIWRPGPGGKNQAGHKVLVPNTDIEKARALFADAGLAFPTIPEELVARLKEQDTWLFSTRELKMSPYNLMHYVNEAEKTPVDDYAVLCHSGHGVNSYALQYYLVHGPLRMFLHLTWGGVYTDAETIAANILDCFTIADKIVSTARAAALIQPGDHLLIVASDFYGSNWRRPGKTARKHKSAALALTEVLQWLKRDREK